VPRWALQYVLDFASFEDEEDRVGRRPVQTPHGARLAGDSGPPTSRPRLNGAAASSHPARCHRLWPPGSPKPRWPPSGSSRTRCATTASAPCISTRSPPVPAHAAPRSRMPSERLAASTWLRSRNAAGPASARSPTLSTSFRGSGGTGSPRGVGSENRPPRTSVQNRRRKTEALAVAGNGITDITTTKERDTDAPKGATPFEGR